MGESNASAEKRIDDYINKLPDWCKTICQKLRSLIHRADSDVVEDWKWGQPTFTHNGKQLCWVWAFAKHVSFTFYQGALMKDSKKIFNYGKDNLRNRTVKFSDVSQIDEEVLIAYIQEAVALNEAGKQVKISVGMPR